MAERNKAISEEEFTEKESSRSESTEKNSSTISIDQILEALVDDPKSLENIPKEERISIVNEAFYSGPLPPPNMIESYEQTLPGSADRVLNPSSRGF